MDPVVLPIALVAALAGAGVGFWFAGRGQKASDPAPADPEPNLKVDEADENDDPTAPITPLVEIARSPHDQHRDLVIGNALVKSIDQLEVVLRSGERQSRESMLGQLGLLKEDFHGLLGSCSFRAFSYTAGTIIDGPMRSRIQIVGGRAGDEASRIARTVRCGFVYEAGGGEEPVVIRKAEVEIG